MPNTVNNIGMLACLVKRPQVLRAKQSHPSIKHCLSIGGSKFQQAEGAAEKDRGPTRARVAYTLALPGVAYILDNSSLKAGLLAYLL